MSKPLGLPATALLLVLIFALADVSVALAPAGSDVAAWWPAAGVSVALLLLVRRSWWPAVLVLMTVVSALGNLVAGRPAAVSACFGVANTVEAVVVVSILTAGLRRPARLQTPPDVVRLLVAVLVGSLLLGVMAATTVFVLLGDPFLATLRSATASHAASDLVIVPLVLLHSGQPGAWGPRPVSARGAEVSRLEVVAQGVAALVVVVAAFAPAQHLPLGFIALPVLMWGALRLRPLYVALQAFVMALVVTLLAAQGGGALRGIPEAELSPTTVAALVQTYLVAIVLVTLPLSLGSKQRRQALIEAQTAFELYHRGIQESLIGTMLLAPGPGGLVVVDVNEPAARLLGRPAEQLRGRPWTAGLDQRDAARIALVPAELASGRSGHWERELRLQGTEVHWVRLALSWVADTPEGGLVTAQLVDLTEARASRVALQQERDFTTAVLDSTESLILVLDRSWRVVRANRAVERLGGLPAAEMVGRPLWPTVLAAADAPTLRTLVADTGSSTPVELDWLTATGERRTVAWSTARLVGDDLEPVVVLTGIDVTGLRRYQAFLQRVLDSTAGTAIVGTDPDGTIRLFNCGAEQLLGHAADDVVGQATPTLFHDPDEVGARAAELGVEVGFGVFVAQAERTRAPGRRDWTWVRSDGTRLTVSLTVSTMTSAGGATTGYVVVAEDVTERRRTEEALRQALDQERLAVERLGELDRMKSDLVASVSHELRTPMTSVLGFTQMLASGRAGPLTDRQEQLLGRIDRNGRRLLSLIEDLLTLSRVEAGDRLLEARPVDLRTVVAAAFEMTEELLAGRRVTVVSSRREQDPVTVSGDEGQLERVVVNLLSNAVKFTPDGGRVAVSLGRKDGEAVLSVADTGIGLSDTDREHVFDAFFRASATTRAAIPGTGLGLTIVKSIVDAHGGTIECRSELGRGTTFEVHLPLGGPGEADGGAQDPAQRGAVSDSSAESSSSTRKGLTR